MAIEPGPGAVPQFILRGHRDLHSRRCCCGGSIIAAVTAADAAVPILLYACSKSVRHSLLREIDAAVRGFCTSHDGTFYLCFFVHFYRKLSQVHAGVNLPFFRADGRILGDYFQRKHSNITRITNSKIQKMFRRPIK